MRPEVRALRNAAAQAAQLQGVRLQEFLDRGLEAVLEEAEQQNWSVKEMAAQLLARCCLTDGRFNNFLAAFLAAMTFLNEQLDPPGEQAYRDLAQILQTAGNIDAIRRWMDSNCSDTPRRQKGGGGHN
jgi:hypothetical protein